MTANAGYHLFNTGDVLTAAQVQYNLQNQTIMYFASSAARSSALGAAVVEGMFSYLADTDSTEYYSGSAWTSISNPGDITSVVAGNGLSGGASSGAATLAIDTAITVDKTTAQTLTNKTLTSPALTTPTISTLTTNGDLLYGTGSGALSRLGIGSTSQVLTVTGGVPVWAAAASTSFPAFSATNSVNQTISAATWTKVQCDTEQFDTASNFASNRFTPTTAGYYQINGNLDIDSTNTTPILYLVLWKNGVAYQAFFVFSGMQEVTSSGSVLVYFNGSTDYVELYARVSAGTGTLYNATTRFTGVGIRS